MRKFAVNGGLVLASFGVAVLLAEFILRMAYPQQLGVWYSLRNGLVIHPPSTRIHLSSFRQDVAFNALGMRDVEHEAAKAPGMVRVLVLGDSFMEALQVRLEDSFPRLLEQRLSAMTGQRVEVINAGVSGWGTDQQLQYLTEYGLALKPDLVLIAMTLHNDVSDNLGEQFHVLKGDQVVARPPFEIPAREFRLLKVKDYLASHSHLTQLMRRYKHLGEVRVAARQLDDHVSQLLRKAEPAPIDKGWRLTTGLIGEIRRQAKAVGARTAVFLIPLSIQVYEDMLRRWLADHELERSSIALEKPQAMMERVGRVIGVDVIDLLDAFREWHRREGKSLHLVGEGHWNVDGHRLVTAVVAEELTKRELIGRQAGR
jgi:GDSL-like lipase/acylhydrolase family protein